jgi:unsaturated chondroitin disaccharide hydrolase
MINLYDDAINRILVRVNETLDQVREEYPHFADPETGLWTTTKSGDWTGGYWCGMLWLSSIITNDDKYRERGKRWALRLEPRIQSDTVFKGFLFYYAWVLGHLLFKDEELRTLAHRGAKSLANMYNRKAGIIPLGHEAEEAEKVGLGETNIDSLIPLPVLFWASKDLGRKEFYDIALNHAKKLMTFCVREDGSICQSATFDPNDGRMVKRYTHKGYSEDSTWARAQAWGIQGFTLAYIYTRDAEFLDMAAKAADYFIDRLPDDRVPFYDFDDPRIPNVEKDTSAAAITASAMVKMAKLGKGEKYKVAAEEIVDSLIRNYLTPVSKEDKRPVGILTNGCYNKRIGLATKNELIWGDYYLLEALSLLSTKIKEVL